MANIIKIKRGSGVPGSGVLEGYELGYDTTNNSLYLGVAGSNPIKIADAFQGYLTIDNATGKLTVVNDFEVTGETTLSTATVNGIFTTTDTANLKGSITNIGNSPTDELNVASITNFYNTITVAAGALASLDGGVNINDIITLDSTTGNIDTTGDLTAQNVVVNGDLTVHGTTTTVESTVVTINDPIFTMGTTPVSPDGKDRGIEFKYGDSTTPLVGFFGLDESTGRFIYIPDAINTSEVFSGTAGDFEVGDIYQGGTNVSQNWNAAAAALGISGGTGGITTATQYDILIADIAGQFQPTKTIPSSAGITIDCGTY